MNHFNNNTFLNEHIISYPHDNAHNICVDNKATLIKNEKHNTQNAIKLLGIYMQEHEEVYLFLLQFNGIQFSTVYPFIIQWNIQLNSILYDSA